LLLYDVVEDYVERRAQFREAHLGLAREALERGELVMAGALWEPVDGAALLFRGDDRSVAERFAEADPYVRNGLVTHWRVRRWDVVVGGEGGGTSGQ
jgi:uncharacterized protein YciI